MFTGNRHFWAPGLAVLVLVAGTGRADLSGLPVVWSQPIVDLTGPRGIPDGVIDRLDRQSNRQFNAPALADDFRSDGSPIIAVRWWGSFISLSEPHELTGLLEIRFYQEDATAHPFSLPVEPPLVYHQNVAPEVQAVGIDEGGDLVYRYEAYLPQPFYGVADTEYFIGINAISHFDGWGWHETVGTLDYAAVGGEYYPWTTSFPETNLAFELMTPEPGTLALIGVGLVGLLCRRRPRCLPSPAVR